jgi:SPP1 family predicted phage head-tail adaptor
MSFQVFTTLDPSIMNTPFTVETLTPVGDGAGGETESYSEKGTGWCNFRYLSTKESVVFGGNETVLVAEIKTYSDVDIDKDDRITIDGEYYRINGKPRVKDKRNNIKIIMLEVFGRDND